MKMEKKIIFVDELLDFADSASVDGYVEVKDLVEYTEEYGLEVFASDELCDKCGQPVGSCEDKSCAHEDTKEV